MTFDLVFFREFRFIVVLPCGICASSWGECPYNILQGTEEYLRFFEVNPHASLEGRSLDGHRPVHQLDLFVRTVTGHGGDLGAGCADCRPGYGLSWAQPDAGDIRLCHLARIRPCPDGSRLRNSHA